MDAGARTADSFGGSKAQGDPRLAAPEDEDNGGEAVTAPVGLGSPTDSLAGVSGWASQLDMAAATRRRVVIHGGVLDRVLLDAADGSVRAVSMVEWLQRRLIS